MRELKTVHHEIDVLVGKIFTKVEGDAEEGEMVFANEDRYFKFVHIQECCEGVFIEDVVGELEWLTNTPILSATETSDDDPDHSCGYGIWTFYNFATIKGHVTIRWYGLSNGYYSVAVQLIELI